MHTEEDIENVGFESRWENKCKTSFPVLSLPPDESSHHPLDSSHLSI